MKKADAKALHLGGGLVIPKKQPRRIALCAPRGFEAPRELLLDGYCTRVENQGTKPYCAAFSSVALAENVLWRKTNRHEDIDPVPIYAHAKTIDGLSTSNGTSIEAALRSLVAKGVFPKACAPRMIYGTPCGGDTANAAQDLKYAIHRYGCAVAGFAITDEWDAPRLVKVASRACAGQTCHAVTGMKAGARGGHAVLVCGYDANGFYIQNSWGEKWADDGFCLVTNAAFASQFLYAGVLTHVLDE